MRKKNKLYASNAFTLIELMVSSTILVLIGAAVLTTFASGLHVYERVQSYGGVQADVLLALEQMEHDIANTFMLSEVPFERVRRVHQGTDVPLLLLRRRERTIRVEE